MLWTRIKARSEEVEPPSPMQWTWLRFPLVVSAVVMLSLVGFVTVTGGPERVLIPLGVKAPPPAVKRAPEMFTKYRMIEKLDMLENFDTVDAVQVDDGEAGKG
ncbi:MAG TPA: hypothetical protein VMT89_17835 [Candidatus Acidoferrales bacterium]|nr:hypothetical protein [Candidatus Acidoferrales bacterium]